MAVEAGGKGGGDKMVGTGIGNTYLNCPAERAVWPMAASGCLKHTSDQQIQVYSLYHTFRSQEVAFVIRIWQFMPKEVVITGPMLWI